MTDQRILEFVRDLNNGKSDRYVFSKKLNSFVELSKVWDVIPEKTNDIDSSAKSSTCFFIKNNDNKYVGAVLNMHSDLHWIIDPECRKKGHLTTALKSAIIPYLFKNGRESQEISIDEQDIGSDNYINSKNVALSLGFKPKDDIGKRFELKSSDFDWSLENLNESNSAVNSNRFEELKKEIFFHSLSLQKISDELTMSVGDDRDLSKIADKVHNFLWELDDLMYA